MLMGETIEAIAILSNHYRSYEMLLAKAHVDGNIFDMDMYQGKLVTLADQFAGMTGLTTYGEVHSAVNSLN